MRYRVWWCRLAAMAVATPFLFGSCDPTLQTTVRDGLLDVGFAAADSFLDALVQVIVEANP